MYNMATCFGEYYTRNEPSRQGVRDMFHLFFEKAEDASDLRAIRQILRGLDRAIYMRCIAQESQWYALYSLLDVLPPDWHDLNRADIAERLRDCCGKEQQIISRCIADDKARVRYHALRHFRYVAWRVLHSRYDTLPEVKKIIRTGMVDNEREEMRLKGMVQTLRVLTMHAMSGITLDDFMARARELHRQVESESKSK